MAEPSEVEEVPAMVANPDGDYIRALLDRLGSIRSDKLFVDLVRYISKHVYSWTNEQEALVSHCVQRFLSVPRARSAQVSAIRRLVWGTSSGGADTMLVARTGYGKSIVLFLFAIITGLVTVQIVVTDQSAIR